MNSSSYGFANGCLLALLAVISFAVPACNDGSTAATGGAGGNSGTTGGVANNGGSAGAQTQGGNDAGGTSAAPGGATSVASATSMAKLGYIQIASTSADSQNRYVSVEFASSEPTNTCTTQTFGDCVFSTNCLDPAATTVFASAGNVSVTCPSPAINVTLQSGANNEYPTQLLNTAFGGGESLHLSAVGSTVPAFSADVTMPKVLLVSSPTTDGSGVIAAPVANGLTINFTRGAADVKIIVSGSAPNIGGLSCVADSTAGTITIPAAALAAIGAGVELELITAKLATIANADWNIDVWTAMPVYTSDLAKMVTVHVQ